MMKMHDQNFFRIDWALMKRRNSFGLETMNSQIPDQHPCCCAWPGLFMNIILGYTDNSNYQKDK